MTPRQPPWELTDEGLYKSRPQLGSTFVEELQRLPEEWRSAAVREYAERCGIPLNVLKFASTFAPRTILRQIVEELMARVLSPSED